MFYSYAKFHTHIKSKCCRLKPRLCLGCRLEVKIPEHRIIAIESIATAERLAGNSRSLQKHQIAKLLEFSTKALHCHEGRNQVNRIATRQYYQQHQHWANSRLTQIKPFASAAFQSLSSLAKVNLIHAASLLVLYLEQKYLGRWMVDRYPAHTPHHASPAQVKGIGSKAHIGRAKMIAMLSPPLSCTITQCVCSWKT